MALSMMVNLTPPPISPTLFVMSEQTTPTCAQFGRIGAGLPVLPPPFGV